MKTTNNPYAQQMIDQGRDVANRAANLGEFPRTIHGRYFETQDQYLQELHEFLNGN